MRCTSMYSESAGGKSTTTKGVCARGNGSKAKQQQQQEQQHGLRSGEVNARPLSGQGPTGGGKRAVGIGETGLTALESVYVW